ncbi:MAG TPA: iron ABC transporter permease [Gemmatimonadales bacterium]|jgi:iron complex transport system permease protein|nr:iron ABC transporter permease [Gemmatimonadales bacterium]
MDALTRARWPLLALAAAGALLVGVAVGAVPLPLAAIAAALFRNAGPDAAIIRDLRVPRVLLGFLVGGSLSVSGAILQALIRNPLADPYILGLSGGAAVGAVAAIALGLASAWALPVAALAGGLLTLALVYRLSLADRRRMDPHTLLLAGVITNAFTGAVLAAVLSLSDAARLRNAFLWLLGGLSGASWEAVGALALYALPPLVLLLWNARWFDLLVLGEDTARHLGADPERLKRLAYFATGLIAAATVATCGMIGFVGLIVPHVIRRLWGPLHRPLLPAAFLLGGAFLVMADALARSVARPIELPVGVVTALLGVPLFAVLLRRSLS